MSVSIVKQRNPKYDVGIKLDFEESKVFAELTKQNVGKKLEVTFRGKVLMKATVRGEIEGGSIGVLRTDDKEEALSLIRELLP